jgi:transposase
MTGEQTMSKRRTFSREYKLEAVKKVVEQGLSFAQVARDLQIRDTLIHGWKKAFQNDGTLQNEVTQSTSVEDELKRLRIENRQLKIERDILKKATAFFAKENN